MYSQLKLENLLNLISFVDKYWRDPAYPANKALLDLTKLVEFVGRPLASIFIAWICEKPEYKELHKKAKLNALLQNKTLIEYIHEALRLKIKEDERRRKWLQAEFLKKLHCVF